MEAALLGDIPQFAGDAWEFVWAPVRDTDWRDGRGYWLQHIFDDRYLVTYFLPLVPILLLFSRRRLRVGIILTGVVFMAYVFGALYPLFWLSMCVAFHKLAEIFAVESKRRDVKQWGPPLAAGFCIAGWYLLTQTFQHVDRSPLTDWLFVHCAWVFPLGARGLPDQPFLWEPFLPSLHPGLNPTHAPPLLYALFANAHNIGTAYFAIRMLHYFSEVRRDGIAKERRTLLNFLAYLCYAPTLMQGPIERFNEFQDEMDTCHERRSWRNVPPAFARIGWGVLKCMIGLWCFGWFWMYIDDAAGRVYYDRPWEIDSYWLLYFGVYIQIYWLYLEFSGYCDISAGIAKLLGYRQIENFNWCWFATSLRDFWRRWHISLSSILRDYIYIPLGGNRRHTTINMMITFAVVGIWHATKFQFIVWGVVMGLMLAINQWWIRAMKRVAEQPSGLLPAIRRGWLRLKPLPQICSWALTMHCFVMSLLIFFGGSGAWRVGKELVLRPLFWLFGLEGG